MPARSRPLVFPVLLLLIALVPLHAAMARQVMGQAYHDESVFPTGIEGERARAVLGAYNSADPAKIEACLEAHFDPAFVDQSPLEEHLNIWLRQFRRTGPLAFHSTRTYTPEREELVLIAKDDHFGAWRGLVLHFTDNDERLIRGMQVAPARTPTNVDPPELNREEFIRRTSEMLDRLCERGIFSGTVLIANGEDVLIERACGEASKRFHVPNTIDTKFNIGSMNKMFTATAIARLAERGVLSYDDPISRYIDESWLPRSVTDRITIHHLLTHTSGLGQYWNDMYRDSSKLRFRDLEDYKPLIRGDEPAFEPGDRFRYSNTGMFLLGVVIEQATGEDYYEHIRKNIHEPAGMTDTGCFAMDEPVENLAIGYVPDETGAQGWRNNLYLHVVRGGPAGGGFSTVRDLHRFALAMLDDRLVSRETRERMWTSHSDDGYGYGFAVERSPAGLLVGHGGGFPGINANLDIFVDTGWIVAVMSNHSHGASPVVDQIALKIYALER